MKSFIKKYMYGNKFNAYNVVLLILAGAINSTGVIFFLSAANLFDSGFSGTSMLLSAFTPDYLPLSFFLAVLNVPFFIFGFKKQGIVFTVYSLIAIASYATFSFIFSTYVPFDPTFIGGAVEDNYILFALFGGLISGVGSGLTIRAGGAIDGVEVMAVIFSKRIGLTVGTFVMIYNAALYIVAGIIEASFLIPLYSIIAYAVGLKAVDFIVDGLDKGKAAMIITVNPDRIADKLTEEFGRGVTIMNATGHYSKEQKTIIYCVVNRFQIGKLTRIVTAIDPSAFVTISEVSDNAGKGLSLSSPLKKLLEKRVPRAAKKSDKTESCGDVAACSAADNVNAVCADKGDNANATTTSITDNGGSAVCAENKGDNASAAADNVSDTSKKKANLDDK